MGGKEWEKNQATGNIAHFPTTCECRSITQPFPTVCKSNSVGQHFPTMCKAPGFIPKSREEGGGRRGARHKGKRGWEGKRRGGGREGGTREKGGKDGRKRGRGREGTRNSSNLLRENTLLLHICGASKEVGIKSQWRLQVKPSVKKQSSQPLTGCSIPAYSSPSPNNPPIDNNNLWFPQIDVDTLKTCYHGQSNTENHPCASIPMQHV